MMQVQIRGDKKVNDMIAELGTTLNKEIMRKSEEFMRFVQKSARVRAPKNTGSLAQSIKIRKTKKNEIRIIVESPYGIYQEEGFRPHWVHALMPTKNSAGSIGSAFNIAGFARVAKNTPFIVPALEAGISRLPTMLNEGTKRGIKRAGG